VDYFPPTLEDVTAALRFIRKHSNNGDSVYGAFPLPLALLLDVHRSGFSHNLCVVHAPRYSPLQGRPRAQHHHRPVLPHRKVRRLSRAN
jgi:hypothetical protein